MTSAIQLLQELVSITRSTLILCLASAGETDVVKHCASWLRADGFETEILEERKGRPSVLGIAKGRGGGRSLMFNGHIDTVTRPARSGLSACSRD